MPQAYSDPKRETDPHALPDVEYWYVGKAEAHANTTRVDNESAAFPTEPSTFYCTSPGWYWWPCFPGCLPDGDPSGPFATEAECVTDFTDESEDE